MAVGALSPRLSVTAQQRTDRRKWLVLYGQTALLSVVIGGLAYISAPHPFSIAFLSLVLLWTAVVIKPVLGIYAAVLFTMIGDTVTVPWYPYTKNFSSRESILFIADQLTINPLEVTILLTTFVWILRSLGDTTWQLHRGRMWTPLMVFMGFTFLGLAYGLSRGGHDTTIAVWEARPLLYIPILYVLITNLLTTPRQYERLFVCGLLGVVVQSVLALQYFRRLDPEVKANLESLTEHAASIQVAALVVFVLALWLLARTSHVRRIWLTAALVPTVWMFVLSQRRAAAVALMIGVLLLAVLVGQRRRWVGVLFALVVLILGGLYTLAFWNSTGRFGFAAQAVKSVIAPEQLTEKDAASNLYRQIEKYDIWFTIRHNELFGVGFGQQFLRPVKLPDISFFVFWQYMPHNSILWIWMKMGVGGFMAMLFLMARTIHRGVQSVVRLASPDLAAIAIGAVAYVAMYMVYCYVDIGWDMRSTVFLALAIAICADLEPLVNEPLAEEAAEEAEPAAELEPVS
jgi:O-antigen ligase